jgi:hypothetical protein
MGAIILQLRVSPGPKYASRDGNQATMMDDTGPGIKQLKENENMHLASLAAVHHVDTEEDCFAKFIYLWFT